VQAARERLAATGIAGGAALLQQLVGSTFDPLTWPWPERPGAYEGLYAHRRSCTHDTMQNRPGDHVARVARARVALEGLSIGDAFGETFFAQPEMVDALIESRTLRERRPWAWTDDTAMALSIVAVLAEYGTIDRDALATAFAERYRAEPWRGYGGTAHSILVAIGEGTPWQLAAAEAFGGEGSMGNGGAMRAAPVGAYFADDLDRVVDEARRSAEPTHAHPDGQAGAVAIAVAAAIATEIGAGRRSPSGRALVDDVLNRTPTGPTHDALQIVSRIDFDADVRTVAARVGCGKGVVSSDTVPLAVWCAARHLDNFEEALWTTVSALGDRDTTCAIVGGIVVMATGREAIPAAWYAAREPLP
jgi:ADP-ribosylglycohydrolase